MKLINKKFPLIGGAILATMFATSASAAIYNLDFDSGFTKTDVDAFAQVTGSTIAADASTGKVNGVDVYEKLSWIDNGSNTNYSTLEVTNFTGLSLDTDDVGSEVLLQTFTQVNNVQDGTFTWSLPLLNMLTVNGVDGDVTENNITFKETLNQAPCPDGGTGTCDDVYIFDNPSVMFAVPGQPGTFIELFVEAGDDTKCTGFGTGTLTCLTLEAAPGTSQVHVKARVITKNIPEPSLFALFALGLFGLGASRRKS